MSRKKKVIIASILLAYVIVVPVFAYVYFYSTEAKSIASGVIVQNYTAPTLGLGIYWDQNCTQPVTTIDFGNLTYTNYQQTIWSQPIYIRNEGNVPLTLDWNSTLPSVDPQIGEWLGYAWTLGPPPTPPIWGLNAVYGSILSNGTWPIYYGINVPAYPTAGTYNWTIGIWGTYSY
jgi:hypothetical protein